MKYYNSFNELYNNTCNTQNISVFNLFYKDTENGHSYIIRLPLNLNDEVNKKKGKNTQNIERELLCSLECQIKKSGWFGLFKSSEQAVLTIEDKYIDVLMPVFYSLASKMNGVALKQKDNEILIKNIDNLNHVQFDKQCKKLMKQVEETAKLLLRNVPLKKSDSNTSEYTYPQDKATEDVSFYVDENDTGDLDIADNTLKSKITRGLIGGVPAQHIPTTVKGKIDDDEVLQ